MRKTGKGVLHFLSAYGVFLMLFLAGHSVLAQSVQVNGTISETEIFTGERVVLKINVSGKNFTNVSNPELPQLQGLQYLSKTPSTSTNYSYVNGVSSRSYAYQYYLQAEKPGKFIIPPVSVKVDGKAYKTEPIHITIRDRNKAANNHSSKGKKPDIFLKMEVSNHHPYIGQQITANVVLYFKSSLDVTSYQPNPGWKAEGFWKEEFDQTQQPQAVSTIINGVRYRKAVLMKYALFPSKNHKLTISPFEVSCSVRYNNNNQDPFSSFFSGFGGFGSSQRNVDLKTDPVSINVRDLPPAPSGVKDIGAVGKFTISRTASDRQVKLGESIEVTTKIKGVGNIALLSQPKYNFPDAFETYQPQQKSDINRKGTLIQGTKTFTDVLVARKIGTYTIPAAKIAYFNNDRRHFSIKTLPTITIHVINSPGNVGTSVSQNNALSIQPVTGLASWASLTYNSIFTVWWFWVGIILPFLFIGVGFWQKQYRDRMQNDSRFARSHTALDNAKKRLEEASEIATSGDLKTAYSQLHMALSGYIGDKLNLPKAGLSDEEYISHLQKQNINPQLVSQIKRILDKCSTIRFAPLTSQEDLNRDIRMSQNILNDLRKTL